MRQEVESQPPPPPPDDDNPEKKEDEEENASATTPVVVAPVILQDPPSVAQTKRVEPNPNHKPDDTPTTAVIDIKTHLSGDVCNFFFFPCFLASCEQQLTHPCSH